MLSLEPFINESLAMFAKSGSALADYHLSRGCLTYYESENNVTL